MKSKDTFYLGRCREEYYFWFPGWICEKVGAKYERGRSVHYNALTYWKTHLGVEVDDVTMSQLAQHLFIEKPPVVTSLRLYSVMLAIGQAR